MIAKIRGTGSYIPEYSMDNHKLAEIVDTNDAWVQERTGIVRRHIVQDETTVSMAVTAAQHALENAGVTAEEIDLLIVSTVSSNRILPCTACEVQKELEAVNATCFDINAACTGFLFALNTANAYMEAGICRKALLIGSESLSNLVNWSDRGTAILFGDGAGAAVVEAQEGKFPPTVTHSNGAKGYALEMNNRYTKLQSALPGQNTDEQLMLPADTYIQMDGQEVFKFAVRSVPKVIEEVLIQCDLSPGDIDYFILHQANKRIVEGVASRLKEDVSKFPMNLMECGNTSSASIPILLDELNRNGTLQPGMKLVLAGFGAGLSWGATYMEW